MNKRKFPAVAVDGVIIKQGKVLLIIRKNDPYKGKYALPGGFVEYGETVEEACVREVEEETGLKVKIKGLVGVYSNPKRDPRGHVISIAFLCEPVGGIVSASSDASEAKWISLRDIIEDKLNLAFDHSQIIHDAVTRFKIKI